MDIGARIRKIRKLKKMTLKEVASKVGISISHLSEIENGRNCISLSKLIDLSEVLSFNPALILNEIPCIFDDSNDNIATYELINDITDELINCNYLYVEDLREIYSFILSKKEKYEKEEA
ncbi:MAG: helix-turn-helix transcriptional regulator [Clostridiales bacterium]|nr:helix-turn-helix transcriptional regulator [Clostridiales bacterium]